MSKHCDTTYIMKGTKVQTLGAVASACVHRAMAVDYVSFAWEPADVNSRTQPSSLAEPGGGEDVALRVHTAS